MLQMVMNGLTVVAVSAAAAAFMAAVKELCRMYFRYAAVK